MALNPRQRKFAERYHATGNATRAYGEAYGSPKTESGAFPNWCGVEGHRLLKNPKVREQLEKLKGETAALSSMSREELVDYLVAAITTPAGEIDKNSPLCEEVTRHVAEDGVEVVKIKAVSKLGAAKELIRLAGMAEPQKVEVSASEDVVGLLREITGAKGGG